MNNEVMSMKEEGVTDLATEIAMKGPKRTGFSGFKDWQDEYQKF